MNFAGIDLARRLERAEATASSRFVEARGRIASQAGAEWMEVAGAYVMFDGAASPITQTFGLGLFATPTEADLDLMETFFRSRGAPVCHEVSPLAGVELAATLAGRGYRPIEFTSVMHCPAGPASTEDAPGIRTRHLAAGEESLWSSLSAQGWGEDPELHEFLRDLGTIVTTAEGSTPFLAELDGRPVATGGLCCHAGVALFAGASTIPEARNRGAQRALLDARMRHAHAQGCDLAMMCAAPGSASQRNAERLGFRIAYTRTKWRLDFS